MTTTSSPEPTSLPERVLSTLATTVSADDLALYRGTVRSIDGTSPEDGGSLDASPLHSFVLAHEAFELAFEAIGAARPDGSEPTRIHLSQEIRTDRLLLPGDRVTVDVRLLGLRRDPAGVRVVMRAVLAGTNGERIAELTTGALLGGATTPEPFGEVPPIPAYRSKTGGTVLTRRVSADGVRRYAAVSGDSNPLHLDDSAAQAAGFDSAIAHGMSVLAMVSEEIIDQHAGGDPTLVREIGVRFSVPVVPEEPIEVTLQPVGDIICFTCRTPRGLALKNGWVALGGPPAKLPSDDPVGGG